MIFVQTLLFSSFCALGFIFDFVLQIFRPLLNISVEFSAEEFETALITPNDTLSDIHMPLLKVGAWFWSIKVFFFFSVQTSLKPFFSLSVN